MLFPKNFDCFLPLYYFSATFVQWTHKRAEPIPLECFLVYLKSIKCAVISKLSIIDRYRSQVQPMLFASTWNSDSATMLGKEIRRCCTRGESEDSVAYRWPRMEARESTLALKPRVDVSRSLKQGVPVAP